MTQSGGEFGHQLGVREYAGRHILAEDGLHQAGELHGIWGDHGLPIALHSR